MVVATDVFRQLSILLLIAVASHFVIKRLRQPTIIGEIGIGIIIGPTIVGFLLNRDNRACFPIPAAGCPAIFDESLIAIFAALGSIFLLFLIGLESDFREIFTRRNVFIASGGVILPWVAGFLVAVYGVSDAYVPPGVNRISFAVFVGAILVATSTAIAAAMLLEMGLIQTRVAKAIMGAAVIDDIIGLLVLSIAIGTNRGTVDLTSLAILGGTATAFILIGAWVGAQFFGRLVVKLQASGERIGLRFGGFMVAIAITFLYAAIAETIGLSAIIGAFVAGTMFAVTPLKADLQRGAERLGTIFTPAFFISMGLLVNLWTLDSNLLVFGIILIVLAFFTKVIGCVIPARLYGMTPDEAWAVGYGMTPRGEVGLIVAQAAFLVGVIRTELFSIIVIALIIVSVMPTLFLKHYLVRIRKAHATAAVTAPPPAGEQS